MKLNLVIANFFANHPYLILIVTLFLTLILISPLFFWAPKEQASPNPPDEVYELQEEIDDKFPTPFHFASFVLQAKKGDVMSQEVLSELKLNRDRLIALDAEGGLSVTEEGKPRGTLEKDRKSVV